MSCNTCPQFDTLPTCLETLYVGTVTGFPDSPLNVYVKNHTTGYLTMFEVMTNEDGDLFIDVPDSFVPVPNHDYELWVTDPDAGSTNDRLTFVIDEVNHTCARFTFELIHAGADLAQYTNQNLTPII